MLVRFGFQRTDTCQRKRKRKRAPQRAAIQQVLSSHISPSPTKLSLREGEGHRMQVNKDQIPTSIRHRDSPKRAKDDAPNGSEFVSSFSSSIIINGSD